MSDFVGEQSRVHIMPISAKWKHKSSIHIGFIVFNGGVTNFFAKSVYIFICIYVYVKMGNTIQEKLMAYEHFESIRKDETCLVFEWHRHAFVFYQ